MSRLFRRTISYVPSAHAGPSSHPHNIYTTLPHKVRERQAKYPLTNPPSALSASLPFAPPSNPAKRFPLKLEEEFGRLRAQGQYKGDEASARHAFLKGQVAWRSRVRGVSGKKMQHLLKAVKDRDAVSTGVEEGEEYMDMPVEGQIVGQRIYLPNIQIRLMRNHTPPGEAYDPTVATFRIPPSMTKTDLRSYLSAVYNLPVTFIRTDNYRGQVSRLATGAKIAPRSSMKNYKRAVVGLLEPFHYPDDVEELRAQGQAAGVGASWAEERRKYLDEYFLVDRTKEYKVKALMKMHKGYRWRSRSHDNQGNIVRQIMKKRNERETILREEADQVRAQRESSA